MTTVTITKTDIDYGVHAHCQRCPGALALTRTFPQFSFSVTPNLITVHDADSDGHGDILAICRTPPALARFIKAFDGWMADQPAPEPISFEIDLSGVPHRNVINPLPEKRRTAAK